MGRGDKRTKRGKITIGSFGKTRPARAAKNTAATATADAASKGAKKGDA